jgi:predicted Fe-S protein YdhL (DUF1289 family)
MNRPVRPVQAARGGLASPCIGICRMHPTLGWCEGCHRTLDEIASWSGLSEPERQQVWRLLPLRRAVPAPEAED